jgi:uncharacterized membrane protein/thiol-disulfide isomerase/thioredoxin
MPHRVKRLPLALLLVFWFSGWLQLSTVGAQEAAVRAVLFYSPTCPHCQHVIQDVLPPLFDQYGDRLQIVGIDITTIGGSAMFDVAVQRFGVPQERQAVPMLIIADTILLGSQEIPEKFPGLIELYLAQGGIDWPDVPGLREALATGQPESTSTSSPTPAPATASQGDHQASGISKTEPPATREAISSPSPTAESAGMILSGSSNPGLGEGLGRDPLGNSLAIIALLGMLISIVGSFKLLLPVVAKVEFIRPSMWVPILCLAGIVVAGYLAYVETTQVEAVCGPVGDCNAVQQSEYARLFGVMPVGVLGLTGYAAILAAWLASRFGTRSLARLAPLALLGMTLIGVLFSVYLTFLEPFVIGATCAWCLASAVIMTLLLWLSIGSARPALSHLLFGEKRSHRKTGYRGSIQSE